MAADHQRTSTRRAARAVLAAAGATLTTTLLLAVVGCTPGNPGADPDPAPPAVVAGPDVRLAATLVPFDACADALAWLQAEALKQVGPYGWAPAGRDYLSMEEGRVAVDSSAPAAAAAGSAGAGSAGSDAGAASGTNVQEAGVDEADLVKNDGRRLLVVRGNRLDVLDVTGPAPVRRGSAELSGGNDWQLLLVGDRVLALGQAWSVSGPESGSRSRPVPYGTSSQTRLVALALDADGTPRVTDTATVDGRLIDARLAGGRAHVVVSAPPAGLPFVTPAGGSAAAAELARRTNEAAVRNSTIDDWLPHVRRADTPAGERGALAVPCERLRHPNEVSGLDTLAVLSLGLTGDALDLRDTVGLLAQGDLVYASASTLYVATGANAELPLTAPAVGRTAPAIPSGGEPPVSAAAPLRAAPEAQATDAAPPVTPVPTTTAPPPSTAPDSTGPTTTAAPLTTTAPGTTVPTTTTATSTTTRIETTRPPETTTPAPPAPAPDDPPAPRTAVHAFALAPSGPAAYRASGFVAGRVRDRWAFSEHAGHLRVVTTTGPVGCWQCPDTVSRLTVLAERDGRLAAVGSVGDMGRGETVRGVRFVGDTGYVVTFRQTDPLYVLDLADPALPRVAGELKIPGYSAYLHPVGDGRLLGVGRDADETGRTHGVKVELFDVRDPARPASVAQAVLPGAHTPVEQDAHAFLWWDPTRLAVVPVSGNVPGTAVGYRVDGNAITEVGRIGSGSSVLRTVVVGDALHAVTPTGVHTVELASLAPRSWLDLGR